MVFLATVRLPKEGQMEPTGRLMILDCGLAQGPYALCRLPYLKDLDQFLVEVSNDFWWEAQRQGETLEPWLFAETIQCLHRVLVDRTDLDDLCEKRKADLIALSWCYEVLDSLIARYPVLRKALWVDECDLDVVLLVECGLTVDSRQYKIAVTLFRLGWLATTDNKFAVPLLCYGRMLAARTQVG